MRVMFTLRGDGLYSKWGFGDGDIVLEALYDLEDSGVPVTKADYELDHQVLIALVRAELLPKLPVPVEVFDLSTIHNPIRVEDPHHFDGSEQQNADVAVEITDVVLLACLACLKEQQ